MIKRSFTYASILALVALIYLPGMTNSFLSDDWSVITRYANLSLFDSIKLFTSLNGGWYRPLFYNFLSICTHLFGYQAQYYHLIILGIYLFTVMASGILVEMLTGKKLTGILTVLFFGIHSVHTEPVLWIASANEIIAGLFVILSMISYICFRKFTKYSVLWLIIAIGFYFAGITTKETASFLPAMFVIYDYLFGVERKHLKDFTIPIGLLCLGIAFALFRIITGSPYSTSVTFSRILINALYYISVEIFVLPDNYGYLTALPLWKQSPLLPIISTGMATTSIAGIIGLLWASNKNLRVLKADKSLHFLLVWCIVALLPVMLTATGRTAFMSSIGIAGVLAIIIAKLWEKSVSKKLIFFFITLFVVANLMIVSYRVYWWRQASIVMQETLDGMHKELSGIPEGTEVCIVNLPDHLHHAYLFRNAMPAINRTLFPNWRIQAVLNNGVKENRTALCQNENTVFIYYPTFLE